MQIVESKIDINSFAAVQRHLLSLVKSKTCEIG